MCVLWIRGHIWNSVSKLGALLDRPVPVPESSDAQDYSVLHRADLVLSVDDSVSAVGRCANEGLLPDDHPSHCHTVSVIPVLLVPSNPWGVSVDAAHGHRRPIPGTGQDIQILGNGDCQPDIFCNVPNLLHIPQNIPVPCLCPLPLYSAYLGSRAVPGQEGSLLCHRWVHGGAVLSQRVLGSAHHQSPREQTHQWQNEGLSQ